MINDRQGNPLSGATAEAANRFDAAVEAFNIYRGDPVALLDEAVALAPDFAMAHLMKAWAFALATEPEAALAARGIVDGARRLPLAEREAGHAAALDALLSGEWTAAGLALDHHLMRHPRDLLALQAGHLIDFFRADARNLRNRIARALPAWTPSVPGYPIVLGMYAFGLEETGDYARSEATGREAVDRQPLDCWAHHAVAHVMEMQGRAADGIGWMRTREPHWSGDGNFFKVHNWWHEALFHIEVDAPQAALALFDDEIRKDASSVAVDLVDASALLWRLHSAGHDVGDRFDEVASAWDAHADGALYPFNDWHAAMAYLGAGREADVERLLGRCRESAVGASEVAGWTRTTGLPLIEGFRAFARGDYVDAVETLHRGRIIANSFGGSHAQRDVIDWTLTEAAIRAGMRETAEALANERLAVRPHSPVNRSFLARAHTGGADGGSGTHVGTRGRALAQAS
ncbi:tetratricopeptide repeat protein [Salinarimonas sp.]|uniref:tetratricopeptide repeat protein n=1 Tax=Salinarimonas sp. TaxID=2766526 RepID=UPI0032D9A6E9